MKREYLLQNHLNVYFQKIDVKVLARKCPLDTILCNLNIIVSIGLKQFYYIKQIKLTQ